MKLEFKEKSREKIKKGAEKLYNAVTSTLGPFGRNVVYFDPNTNQYQSTKDGVTVAKQFSSLEDEFENVGAQILKQVSINTANKVGDGTTTTTLLAFSLLEKGIYIIDNNKNINVVEFKKGIESAGKDIIQQLKDKSIQINSPEQVKQIALISSNGDEEISNLISEAMEQVGIDGVVTVEESRNYETSLEIVEGIQFDRGYKSIYFVTNNDNMTAYLKDAKILIYNGKINQVKELLPILENCSQENKPILIIADDIDGEALSTLVVNKIKGILKVCAVKAPDYGDRRVNLLEDIAILTGGQVVSPEKGMKLDRFHPDWLGSARTITVSKDTTTIVDGGGQIENIENRLEEIKKLIDNSKSQFEIQNLQERLAKISGGVAIINVGANSEIELKEKKDRVDDALHATKAALEEGVLPGGGLALYSISNRYEGKLYPNSDQKLGAETLLNVCKEPLYKIFNNSGKCNKDEIDNLLNKEEYINGYDIFTNKPINMYESGIIDPLKVTRLALENAISVAGTMLITDCVLIEDKKLEKESWEQ